MRNIEDVQNAAGGGLGGRGLSGIVGNMVAINDVVVPVSLSRLESCALKSEGSLECTRFGGRLVLGERKLTGIVVPRAEKVYGLDAGRCSQRERELNGCHCGFALN